MDDPGICEPLLEAVRGAWQHLADPHARFATAPAIRATETLDSRLCPQGWCGIVTIGGAVLATAPSRSHARALEDVLNSTLSTDQTDLTAVVAALRALDVLGPAQLAYLPRPAADGAPRGVPAAGRGPVHTVNATDPLVQALAVACPAADVAEAGVDTISSPAFVLTHHGDPEGEPLAVAGYEHWPSHVAHLGVLTHPAARGAGSARAVAAAATEHACRAGLLPQWRARSAASVRVARALGYRLLGQQLSLRLTE